MRTQTEATDRKWKLVLLGSFLGVVLAIGGMLTTGAQVFLWLGVASAVGLLLGGVGAWLTSG